jgi:hypothetical protein
MTLDCQSVESAEKSLAQLLKINRQQLCGIVKNLAEADFPVNSDIVHERWFPLLEAASGRAPLDIDNGKTCWFHATRVRDFSTFNSGIRSLGAQMDHAWDSLLLIFGDSIGKSEWQHFRSELEKDHYGQPKDVFRAWRRNEGPYAFLFAETPLKPNDGANHDYLAISELVEFILVALKRKYRLDFMARFQAATRPALVKFASPGISALHMGAALDYLIHRMANWSISCLSPCFSGRGAHIQAHDILEVIPVKESRRWQSKYPFYELTERDHLFRGESSVVPACLA